MRNILMGSFAAILFANDAALAAGGTQAADAPKPFEYDEDRYFFTVAKREEGVELINKIAAQIGANGQPKYSMVSWSEDWPTDAGIAILPLARNFTSGKGTADEKTERVCYAVEVWPYWDYEAVIAAGDKGIEYLSNIIKADQAARILNPMRKQDWEHGKFDPSACPKTLTDHIEGMAADGGAIKAYNEVAKLLLPSLRNMALVFKNFTPAFLRSLLSNAAIARSFSAKLEDGGFWGQIIDQMEAEAKRQGLNVEIFQTWRDTRNEQQDVDLDSLDLSKLSFGNAA